MDLAAMRNSVLGELVPISGTDGRSGDHYNYYAYLAEPLPRSVEPSAKTWTVVVEAESMLARLDEAARQIPTPALLRRPALQREAQSTSALEGTFAPLEAVLESDEEEWEELSSEVREIVNYVVAAEQAFGWIGERPLATSLIAGLQKALV
jgi:Fic family protein